MTVLTEVSVLTVLTKNMARIAKSCPGNISFVVEVSSCFYQNMSLTTVPTATGSTVTNITIVTITTVTIN